MITTALKSFFFILFTGFILSAYAQNETGYQKVKINDFQISDEFTSNSEAVILKDSGYSYYNDQLELIFTHSTRIKILKEAGRTWGNVRIPYNKKDSLININAVAYNIEGNSIITTPLNLGAIKSDTINNIVETYFSIPNSKVGSIIEYTYSLKINNWQEINTWYFQNEVPVLTSTYTTSIPSFMLFYKNLTGVRGLDNLERSNVKDSASNYLMRVETYTMDSIPAFIPEQDIPGGDYFVSKIKFHLAEYTLPGQDTRFILPENYEELALNWAGDPYFRQVYSRSYFLTERINNIFHKEFSPLKNIQSFYYFIRNNFQEDISQESTDLEDIYNDRAGSAQQINMLLTKILNQAGFDAYLIALSTISNRPTYPEYPNFEVFNHFVSMVRINGQNYFMDASDPNLLFGMLTPNSINNSGLVISRTAPGFVPLDYEFQDKEQVVGNFIINDTAAVNGTLEVKREGYSVYNFDSRFLSNNRTYNDYLIEVLFENLNWNIKEHEVTDDFEGNKIIKEVLDFNRPADSIAKNYMKIKPIVFNEYEVNPFQEKERQNPLTVYTPILRKASYNYTIPEGWELKKLPQSKSFALNGSKAKFMYNSKMNGDKLTIEYMLEVNQVIYMSDEYQELSGFFELAVQLLNQEIILIK